MFMTAESSLLAGGGGCSVRVEVPGSAGPVADPRGPAGRGPAAASASAAAGPPRAAAPPGRRRGPGGPRCPAAGPGRSWRRRTAGRSLPRRCWCSAEQRGGGREVHGEQGSVDGAGGGRRHGSVETPPVPSAGGPGAPGGGMGPPRRRRPGPGLRSWAAWPPRPAGSRQPSMPGGTMTTLSSESLAREISTSSASSLS